MAAATAEIAVADPSQASAPSMTAEDAHLFDALTSEEQLSKNAGRRFVQQFQERMPAHVFSRRFGSGNGGGNGPVSSASASRAALLAAFTPVVLRRLVVRMDNCIAAGDMKGCAVPARTLRVLCLCGAARIGNQLLELFRIVFECNGLHPLLNGGVLLPIALRLLNVSFARGQDNPNPNAALQLQCVVAYLVQDFHRSWRLSHSRPRIESPATDRIAAAVHNAHAQQSADESSMQRLDSDSLCSVISFLCGCDFLRVLRVCRRWSLLRMKPAAWPFSRPCSAHSVSLVDTFFPLFDIRHNQSFDASCIALSTLDGAGVQRLLELDGLNGLLPLLDASHESRIHDGVLRVLERVCSVDDSHFAPLLGEAGIVPKLVRLLHVHARRPRIQRVGLFILTRVLRAVPARMDEALAAPSVAPAAAGAGNISIGATSGDGSNAGSSNGGAYMRMLLYLATAVGPDDEPHLCAGDAVGALMSIVHDGTDAHRNMLLAEGVVPVLVSAIVLESAGKTDLHPTHTQSRLQRICNRIHALWLLLEIKQTATATEVALAAPLCATGGELCATQSSAALYAAAAAPLDASLRAQLEPLLHHRAAGVRVRIRALLREFAGGQWRSLSLIPQRILLCPQRSPVPSARSFPSRPIRGRRTLLAPAGLCSALFVPAHERKSRVAFSFSPTPRTAI